MAGEGSGSAPRSSASTSAAPVKTRAGRSLIAVAIAVALGALMAAAGSQGGGRLGPLPAFAACALLAFCVQWLAFIPAYLSQSEKYYDLTGSLTYLSVAALGASVYADARALLLAALIAVWALRLGSFLFLRIRDAGSDSRFDRIKTSFPRFLLTWTLQGLWVVMTAAAALAAMTSETRVAPGPLAVAGLGVWLLGFAIEVVADNQKRRFRRDPGNRGRFIRHGLWAWSRHPNYAGEILLWLGVAIIALPALSGWQYLTLLSPLFVYLLLTRVSGVPLLEAQAGERWGDDPAYRDYRDNTPVLWPRPPRRGNGAG
jgi:steroid 5-alpha reductase family enzyme